MKNSINILNKLTFCALLALALQSCSNDEIIVNETPSAEEVNLKGSPPRGMGYFAAETTIISVADGCFKYLVNEYIIDPQTGDKYLSWSAIVQSGDGCDTQSVTPVSLSSPNGGYKKDVIIQDLLPKGEPIWQIWDAEKDAYQAFINARDLMISQHQ